MKNNNMKNNDMKNKNNHRYLNGNIQNTFIVHLLSMTKPIPVGITYKPSNQTQILEQMIMEHEILDPKD